MRVSSICGKASHTASIARDTSHTRSPISVRPSSLGRSAAFAEAALFNRERGLSAAHGLTREIAVAGNAFRVAGVNWPTEGNVHAGGVPLQADDQRQLSSRGIGGKQKVTGDKHVLLAFEHEARFGVAVLLARPLDSGFRRDLLKRKPQPFEQPGARPCLPFGERFFIADAIRKVGAFHAAQHFRLRIVAHMGSSDLIGVVNRIIAYPPDDYNPLC